MAEITKDFIKFIAEVITLLIIFSVIFSPGGIASTTFNYFVFAGISFNNKNLVMSL